MKRKSVYLFSVAILGFSLMPSSAWADETTETAAPIVTTELVEQPSTPEQPGLASEEMETVQTESEATAEEPAAFIPDTSETSESDNEANVPTELIEQADSETNPVTAEEETAEPTAGIQQKAVRATTPALKGQEDGKIVDHEKTITDENVKIPAEYNFMPNFDHLDGIEVNSSTGYRESGSYFSFDLERASAGSIVVIYKNVGTYNGKVIDMKVTVKDWTILASSSYSQSIYIHKKNGITMRGIKDVRLNYSFLDNLTASAVNVSGFFNFTDIDLRQSIDLFDNNNIQNFFVTKGNELYYKTHNGYIRIGEINTKSTNARDMNYWLTYTYKGVSSFDVRYNQDYESGAVFNYTYQAPMVIEETPTEPEVKDPEVVTEAPEKETSKIEPKEVQAEPTIVNVVVKTEKTEMVNTQVEEAKPLKQAVLPQTNDQNSPIFVVLGGACLFLLSLIFLKKKKA